MGRPQRLPSFNVAPFGLKHRGLSGPDSFCRVVSSFVLLATPFVGVRATVAYAPSIDAHGGFGLYAPIMRSGGLILMLVIGLVGCKRSGGEVTAQSRELFVNACSRCHGVEGVGGLPIFDGGPSPRNFHDHDFQKSRTDEELKQTIKSGKGVGMPPFGSTFDDAQLALLVTQIRSFDSALKN